MIATVSDAPVADSGVESGPTATTGRPARAPAPAHAPARARRVRRPSTPLLLRVAMGLACLPVAFFAAAVQLGVARNDSTVNTVARDATRGITVAQELKLNLAELDQIVVRDLLDPVALGPSGFPDDYAHKRAELHDNLVLAAQESSSGAAYRQPLANIDYALAHYHTLVKDAFAAHDRGEDTRAAELYGLAGEVMEGTLLSQADFVDKANTYVLNNTYDRQKARAASTQQVIVVSWVVLLVFLVLTQLLLARMFRRLLNLPLVLATALTVLTGVFALARLDASASDLTTAREQAFDSVHVLARARATVVSARQAQGQLLLDPALAATAQTAFETQAGRLFRVQDMSTLSGVATVALEGDVPAGAGGYLAKVAFADAGGAGESSSRHAVVAFGEFLASDADLRRMVDDGETDAAAALYRSGVAFNELTQAIDGVQALDQATFDEHADSATSATADLDRIAAVAAAAVLLLIALGLFQRLREYGR